MELIPLRIENQIADAINNIVCSGLQDKINLCNENINKITEINRTKVYNISIKGNDIFYTIRKNNGRKYYYPIQYARILITE